MSVKTPDESILRMRAAHAARMGRDPLTTPAPTSNEVKRAADFETKVAALAADALRDIEKMVAAPPPLDLGARPGPAKAPVVADPAADAVAVVGGKLTTENVRGLITAECRALEALLHEKNRKYGNSALDPKRIFSKASPVEQICVRIDDKISRIANTGFATADEDTLQDLQGYITLLRVAHRLGMR